MSCGICETIFAEIMMPSMKILLSGELENAGSYGWVLKSVFFSKIEEKITENRVLKPKPLVVQNCLLLVY